MTEEELRTRAGRGGRRVRARAAEGRRLAAVEKEAEPGGDVEGWSRAFAAGRRRGWIRISWFMRMEGAFSFLSFFIRKGWKGLGGVWIRWAGLF